MNLIKATEKTSLLIDKTDLPMDQPEYGKNHLYDMAEKIHTGEVKGEKAHRWIGWIQACICMGNGATLEDLKEINK